MECSSHVPGDTKYIRVVRRSSLWFHAQLVADQRRSPFAPPLVDPSLSPDPTSEPLQPSSSILPNAFDVRTLLIKPGCPFDESLHRLPRNPNQRLLKKSVPATIPCASTTKLASVCGMLAGLFQQSQSAPSLQSDSPENQTLD